MGVSQVRGPNLTSGLLVELLCWSDRDSNKSSWGSFLTEGVVSMSDSSTLTFHSSTRCWYNGSKLCSINQHFFDVKRNFFFSFFRLFLLRTVSLLLPDILNYFYEYHTENNEKDFDINRIKWWRIWSMSSSPDNEFFKPGIVWQIYKTNGIMSLFKSVWKVTE